MANWLRKETNAKIDGNSYGYGDEIPSSALAKVDKKVLEKWKVKGWIGAIAKPGVISGKDAYEQKIAQLQKDKEILTNEKQEEASKNKEFSDRIKELEDEGSIQDQVKKLKEELDASHAAELKKLKEDLDASHGNELQKLKDAHAAELKKLKEGKK